MREVNETQAAKEWSKIEVILTEQEEMLIAQDFAKDRAKYIACWLLNINGAAQVKKEYAIYRAQVISWRQERVWKERTGARYDMHRGQYLAHI